MDDVITLDHTVELYIPTHCRCGQKLPEALRDTVTRDIKKQFNAWFKGFSVQHGVPGNWASPDRKHAEEAFDIVYSTCEHDTLEAVTDDVKALAVSVADRLNQDRVALVIDGRMLLYPSSRRHAPCLHETAARLESAPKDLDKAMQVGNPAGKLDRLQAIHALVQRDWCENTGLQAARDLFCGLLGYEYAGGHLPCFRWPDTLSRHLAAIPTILADANGFKVVYLQLSREKLLRMPQREVITRILHDDPSFRGLFLVSCKARKHWELVNARISSESTRGLILRRLQIGVSDGGRTTTERLAIVDITDEETLESAAIQLRHDDAFDVEAVTREFYKDYARVFEQIEARLSTGLDAEERRRFVQTLFNRLMFLRFVERKGWMKLDGRTRRDYLRALYRAGQNDEKPFYQNRLRRLFFEGLAKEKDQPTDLIGHVPFLNGGLFEESALDKKVRDIAGEAFEPLIGTNGLLYRYNFTVLESTPLDVEVAVDPEMLGKVFEELVTGRHESGAYYTPRPIVAFMCREALKGHLLQKTDCSSDAIAALVDDHDVKGISPVNAGQIVDALEHLKAVDPACGSGAYLLGLLHEMVSLYQLLFREELVSAPRSLYDLKLHIISHNLYGVDIDPLAVNIAMLRLWLSLIVEFEGNNPPSLPNLDFKIECGDSLSGPNPEALPDLLGDYLRKQAIGLAKEKDNYLRAHGKLKEVLQASITKHQKRIARDLQSTYGPGIIDWAVNFAEVFATNTGFDIVLANPPYVRKEEIRQALKEKLKANFSEAITGQSDLYCSFYARGVQILREGGMHVFVCSSSWLDATYGRKLQSFLLERCTLIAIYDSAVEKQFSTANINTIISIAQKGKREFNARFVLLKKPFFDALTNPNLRSEYVISQKELFDSASREGVYLGEKWGGKYLRAPDIYREIFGSDSHHLVQLSQIADIKGYIHDNNTGPKYPQCTILWTVRDATRIFIDQDSPGIRRVGVNPGGISMEFAPILFPRTFGSRHLVPLCKPGILGKEFYKIFPKDTHQTLSIVAQLNSTLGILQREILGIKSLGGGALKFAIKDVAMFQILPLIESPTLKSVFDSLSIRELKDIPAELDMYDRRTLDNLIFDQLGIPAQKRDAIYDAVRELVKHRMARARG